MELGKPILLIWDKEKCPWPDSRTIPERLQNVLLIRPLIWNSEKGLRNILVHQIANKIIRTDQNQNRLKSIDPIPSVQGIELAEIRNCMQQQFDVCKHILQQNEILQQTLTQLQSNLIQLQQKVDSLSLINQSLSVSPGNPAVVSSQSHHKTQYAAISAIPRRPSVGTTSAPKLTEPNVHQLSSSLPSSPSTMTIVSKTSDATPVQKNNNNNNIPSSTAVKSRASLNTFSNYKMEGWLHKLGGSTKTKWESRYFVVDSTALLYHENQQVNQKKKEKNIY